MKTVSLTTALALVLCLPTMAMARVVVFDMGTQDSAVWEGLLGVPSEGASRVAPDDPRWQSPQGLSGHDSPAQGAPVWTNALNQDAVIGTTANRFRFPAAPGLWNVYVLAGVGARYPQGQHWDFDVSVGGGRWRFQLISPEDWGYSFQSHVFRVRSAGEIEVKLTPRTKWCLAGIIAWPEADEAAARELISRVEQWAPDAELAKWTEVAGPPPGPSPALAAADRKRGFIIWHRHWATPIYPDTNPLPGEMDPTLRLFAAPGEYEPLTFTVRPLRALKSARVTVEGVGPVPSSEISVRKVRYLRGRRAYTEQGLYRIIPDLLDRWTSGPLAADENATFWLTVHVPETARPGIYHSTIVFAADGQRAAIPVVLRVLHVKLREDPEHDYGIYYDDPLFRATDAPDAGSRRYWLRRAELERADMVAHGIKNVPLSCWTGPADEHGKFQWIAESFENLNTQLEMARRFGFHPPFIVDIASDEIYRKYTKEDLHSHLQGVKMPPDAFFSEMSLLIRTIEAERVRRGWPEFVYQPYDEPSQNPDVVAFMARLCQAVQAGGGRVYVTASSEKPAYQPMKPFVNVWCTQTFLPDHDAVVADMQARDVKYWCYPNDVSGELEHTIVPGARMTFGFGFWRSGFLRLIPWIYQYNSGDPFNYLDGHTSDFMVRSEPDGRPLPTAVWEAFREGYDDVRYIYSLKQAIAQAQGSHSAAVRREAEAAQRTLDSVWTAIPVLPQYRFSAFWSPEEMDVHRWMIAERLERLTYLLRAAGETPALPATR
jgi:hypothetical protein